MTTFVDPHYYEALREEEQLLEKQLRTLEERNRPVRDRDAIAQIAERLFKVRDELTSETNLNNQFP